MLLAENWRDSHPGHRKPDSQIKGEKCMPAIRTSRLASTVFAGLAAMALAGPAVAQTVSIGAIIELSGRFSSFGSHCQRGMEMAAKAYGPTVIGRKYEFVYRDVQSEARGVISAFAELGNTRHINYVIGPLASPVVAAAMPPWQQTKPLWMIAGASSLDVEEMVGKEPMFFHSYPYAYHYHKSLAGALKNALGAGKTIAVLYSDDAYGRSHLPAIEKYYTEAGFKIIAKESVRTNSPDMTPVLTRVGRMKPDILLGVMQTTDAITLAKQEHTLRLKIPYLVGTAATQLVEWQKAVGEAQEGWLGISTYLPGNENWPADKDHPKLLPSTKDWEAMFDAAYHTAPDYDDVTCYADVAMLLLAIDKAGSDDREKVAQALREEDVMTPMGRGHYEVSEGTKQQAFADLLVFQRQHDQNVILYPAAAATGKLAANN
jgi:branched-chain amino acid transport system substrate-binding protein